MNTFSIKFLEKRLAIFQSEDDCNIQKCLNILFYAAMVIKVILSELNFTRSAEYFLFKRGSNTIIGFLYFFKNYFHRINMSA